MSDDDPQVYDERNPPPPTSAGEYAEQDQSEDEEYPAGAGEETPEKSPSGETPDEATAKPPAPADGKVVDFKEAKSKKKRPVAQKGKPLVWMKVIQDVLKAYPDLKIVQDEGDKKPAGYRNWDEELRCWISYTSTDIFDIVSDFAQAVKKTEKHDTLVNRACKFLDVELRRDDRKTSHEEWDTCMESIPLGRTGKAYSLTKFKIIDNPKSHLNSMGSPVTADELQAGFDSIYNAPEEDEFMQKLEQLHPKDPDKIKFLQRLIGQAVLGNDADQALILTGGGGDGKSFFLECIAMALGDDLCFETPEDVYLKVGNQTPDEHGKLGLATARLSTIQEVSDVHSRWQEGAFKRITAGNPIKVRRMFTQDYVKFQPRCMPVVVGNHLPIAKDIGYGMTRRINVVHFLTSQDKKSTTLTGQRKRDALFRMRGSILAWILNGAEDMNNLCKGKEMRVPACSSVTDETMDYFTGEDEFLYVWNELCEKDDSPQAHMSLKDFKNAFDNEYHDIARRLKVDSGKFKRLIKDRPDLLKAYRKQSGYDGFYGWRLRPKETYNNDGGGHEPSY